MANAMIFGTIGAATLMGWLNQRYGEFGNAYAFLWLGGFNAVACIGLWTVFILWRRYGAEKFTYDPEESRGKRVMSGSVSTLWCSAHVGVARSRLSA